VLIKSNLYLFFSQVLRTQLIHGDHPNSLLSKAYNTSSYSQRVVAAVKRSLASGDYFSGQLMSSKGGFESQVIPDERSVQYSTLTEYTMAVSIGTPPQQFCVFIDTGSDLFWLNCKPCNQCISHSYGSPLDPCLSSSYVNTLCTDKSCQVRKCFNEKLLTQIMQLVLEQVSHEYKLQRQFDCHGLLHLKSISIQQSYKC